jgi:hypothetical protein
MQEDNSVSQLRRAVRGDRYGGGFKTIMQESLDVVVNQGTMIETMLEG